METAERLVDYRYRELYAWRLKEIHERNVFFGSENLFHFVSVRIVGKNA